MGTLSEQELEKQVQAVFMKEDVFQAAGIDSFPGLDEFAEGEEGAALSGFHSFLHHTAVPGAMNEDIWSFVENLATGNLTNRATPGRSHFNAIDYSFNNSRSFAGFIAYFMNYIFIIKPPFIHVNALISALGLKEMIALFEKAIADFSRIQSIKVQAEIPPIGTFEDVVQLFCKYPGYKIVRHPLFAKFMGFSEKWLQERLGVHIDTNGFRKNIEEAYQVIQSQPANATVFHGFFFAFGKYDYSAAAYQKLKNTMNRVAGVSGGSVSGWNCTYASEKWFCELGVGTFVHGIREYHNRLESVNKDCLAQTERIFQHVWQIDERNAHSIHMCTSRLKQVRSRMRQIAEQIG